MSLLSIDLEGYEKLFSLGLDMNDLFALHLCLKNLPMISEKESVEFKLSSWRLKLMRKGLITSDSRITLSGIALYNDLCGIKCPKCVPKKESDFERWWKVWPATDKFEYKYRSFELTRTIRSGKKQAEGKFKSIMNEGDYTVEEMIAVLEQEILAKKEESVRTGDNKLKYLNGPVPYLNQRKFEALIEQMREDKKKTKKSNIGNTMQI